MSVLSKCVKSIAGISDMTQKFLKCLPEDKIEPGDARHIKV